MEQIQTRMSIEVEGEWLDVSLYIPEDDACEMHIFFRESNIVNLCTENNYNNIVEQMALLKSKVWHRVCNIGLQYSLAFGDNECFGLVDGKFYLMFFGHR